jgi:hypothetical protein
MTNFEEKVANVARLLLLNNSNISTLDIKNTLRSTYPNERWYQHDISEAMDIIFRNNIIPNLIFNDNGKYREYYIEDISVTTVNNGISYISPPVVKKVPKTTLLDIMKSSKGKFFTVSWIKKDGSERTANGKVTQAKFQNQLGYIVLKTKKDEYKLVDPRTLKSATLDGIHYVVK